jgi:hypothetical protein
MEPRGAVTAARVVGNFDFALYVRKPAASHHPRAALGLF